MMLKVYSVIWSPIAKLTYYKILEYLSDEWTKKELNAFIQRTEEVINLVGKSPLIYPYSKDSQTHKCVVVKQISLFYRINADKIELLLFWDNRQNPAKLLL